MQPTLLAWETWHRWRLPLPLTLRRLSVSVVGVLLLNLLGTDPHLEVVFISAQLESAKELQTLGTRPRASQL